MKISSIINKALNLSVFILWTLGASVLLLLLLEYAFRSLRGGSKASFISDAINFELDAYAGREWLAQFKSDFALRQRTSFKAKKYEPYSLWLENAVHSETFNVGSDGLRITTNKLPLHCKRIVKVYVFGGSTVFGAQVPDRLTIPSQLSNLLNTSGGNACFEVSNYGIDGYVFDQEVLALTNTFVNHHPPEIAIFYDGFNDVLNKVYIGQPHTLLDRFSTTLDRKAQVTNFLIALIDRLSIVRHFRQRRDQAVPGPTEIDKRTEALVQTREIFRKLVKGILKDQNVFFYFQPQLATTLKKLSPDERMIEASYPPKVLEILRSSSIRVAENEASRTTNLTGVLNDMTEAAFIDYCHVTDKANHRISEAIARDILEQFH